MALEQHVKAKRYSVKLGKIISWDKSQEGNRFTGTLRGVYIRENTYEGRQSDKLNLVLEDSEGKSIVDFPIESWSGFCFMRSAVNLNLTQPFSMSVYPSKKNDKVTFMTLYQDNMRVEQGNVPEPKKVIVGKNEIMDYTEFREFVNKWVEEMVTKLRPNGSNVKSGLGTDSMLDEQEPQYQEGNEIPF